MLQAAAVQGRRLGGTIAPPQMLKIAPPIAP